MAATKVYSYTGPELGSIANIGKDMMLDRLVREGFLTRDQANIAKRKFFVVIQKKSWLSQVFTIKKGEDEDSWSYVMCQTEHDIDTGKVLDEFKPDK